jgi:hypothetical protein
MLTPEKNKLVSDSIYYELPEIVKGEDDIGFWKEYENY